MDYNLDFKNRSEKIRFSWRALWYCVLIWIATYVAAGVFLFPWFYLVLPFMVLATTIYYFRKKTRNFASGLALSVVWFGILLSLAFLEIIGPYYSDALFYFSDIRNWFLYPLVLLIPAIYGLFVENKENRRLRDKKLENIEGITPRLRYH